jgi:hypothetical protein
LTLNDYISASGKLILNSPPANNDITIGHFNSADVPASNGRNLLAFSIADPLAQPRLGAFVGLASGSTIEVLASGPPDTEAWLQSPIVHDWGYTYDPAGGPTGDGQLIVGVTNTWTSAFMVRTLNLTTSQRVDGATFDSFGIVMRGLSTSSNLTVLFIDDVTYSVGGEVRILAAQLQPANQFKITFRSGGASHVVKETATLSPPSWSTVPNVTFAGPSNLVWTAQFAAPAGTNRFYRILANPNP